MKKGSEFILLDQNSKWLSVKFIVTDVGEDSCFVELYKDNIKNRIEVTMNEIIKLWVEGIIVFTNPDIKCLNTEEVFNSLYE